MGRPSVPVTVWVLSAVVGSGLVALFLAARAAFGSYAGREQAVAAALLIEAGTVVEALALARSRNRIAGGALAVSYLVSLSYNYTQVHDARPGLAVWQLVAFAAGPLSALTFISLALGEELRLYGERVAEWSAGVEHREDLRIRREERRQERLKRLELGRSASGQRPNGRTGDRHWPDKGSFVADSDRPRDLSAVELAAMTGQSVRNARRWLAAAREYDERRQGVSDAVDSVS